ncbi:MAG TPA: pirin family protein, partial [Chitinophagales bacterium]|nr:pirin family protein [Chitinophagales bacterium]
MDNQLPRRSFITRLSLAVTSLTALPLVNAARSLKESFQPISKMKTDPIKSIKAMGFQWETADPFLFCVHHEDHFPAGNEAMGPPASSLNGRHMGDDFIIKDGFRMYHGKVVPGFPGHPHRGFETITVVRKGLVDHADSMGASGRYGNGDVQWMTAGKGVQHSEMFPLIHKDKDNTMELFQIWLNLPKHNKMVEPHFKMLWAESIPNYTYKDKNSKISNIEVIAGAIGGRTAVSPPPNSWAANPQNHVAVWNIKMQPGA